MQKTWTSCKMGEKSYFPQVYQAYMTTSLQLLAGEKEDIKCINSGIQRKKNNCIHLITNSKASWLPTKWNFDQSSSSSSSGTNMSYFSREDANNSPNLNPTNANSDTTAATLTTPNWCGWGGLDKREPVLLVTTVLEGNLLAFNLKDILCHELRELLRSNLPAMVLSKRSTLGTSIVRKRMFIAWSTRD